MVWRKTSALKAFLQTQLAPLFKAVPKALLRAPAQ
jgi:hypothetical protein